MFFVCIEILSDSIDKGVLEGHLETSVEHVTPYTRERVNCGGLKNDGLKQNYFLNKHLETFSKNHLDMKLKVRIKESGK